ncbi:MAG: DUF559 domain-containing protein [Polyangiaceae bacterium]
MSKVQRSSSAIVQQRARQMRFALTPSEAALWEALRGGRLGVKFRRQVAIGCYIADFLAPRACLIVEVDGAYHAQRRAADARRDRALGRLGYRVLRIDAAVVLGSFPAAIERVRVALGAKPSVAAPRGRRRQATRFVETQPRQ